MFFIPALKTFFSLYYFLVQHNNDMLSKTKHNTKRRGMRRQLPSSNGSGGEGERRGSIEVGHIIPGIT